MATSQFALSHPKCGLQRPDQSQALLAMFQNLIIGTEETLSTRR
jgi:hypothetical protein